MDKISIQEYIAYNNRPMAQKMLVKYGLKPAKSPVEMERKLIALTRDYKEDALREFANIHPDKELILKYANREEKKSNACGCSGFDGDDSSFCGCSGFDGVTPSPTTTPAPALATTPTPAPTNGMFLKNENLGVILIAGLLAVTIVALSKK
ncbi:hypothetical protein K9M18_05805 [Candidatus Woesearchaeota archaeon]|nr:hypothetical protein [Candidatus Woesearchaeota archaeon]